VTEPPRQPESPPPAATPPSDPARDARGTPPAAKAKEGQAAKAPAVAAKPTAKAEPKTPPPPSGPPDPPPPADAVRPDWLQDFERALPGLAVSSYWVGDWTVIVPLDRLIEVLTWMRDTPSARFDYCCDVTAVDWPPRRERFDVVYSLYSIPYRRRVRVKVRVADEQPVPTATTLWPGVNWLEREVFDLFGIRFAGHPDLRRMLMPEDWQGHPQRKDYPLEGPGELLLENPLEWLKLRSTAREAELE
jgi:NADH-quinone oxidoreductase subunit C